jgi:hypothetical protein
VGKRHARSGNPVAAHPLSSVQRLADENAADIAVQRHADQRPLGPDDPVPEETAGEEPSAVQAEPEEQVAVSRQARDDDIPPLPPAFPHISQWPMSELSDTLSSLWGMTCQDRTERGFYVMWNEKTGKIWAGDTQIGQPQKPGDKRAYLNLVKPDDRPPVYPVGDAHTHPPPYPGYTSQVGPSDIDIADAKQGGLPGMVEDYKSPAFKKGDGSIYFYGKERRET